MEFSFVPALQSLGPNFAFRLINEARPAGNYLWAQILPERPMPTYQVKTGAMTVRSAMAGLVGMDSPYPPTGQTDISTFLEESAKLGNQAVLTEGALRTLQQMLMYLQASGASTNERLVEEALNFTNAVLIQPHLDAAEWLRGQALCVGAIDWTFGPIRLQVDYGIPSANKLTHRTGNDAYSGSASKFWDDVKNQGRKLRASNSIMRFAHPDLIEDIIGNSVNAVQVITEDASMISLRRMISQNGVNTPSSDMRDSVTIYKYGMEGEIIDPANPAATIAVPFMPKTKLVAIGTGANSGYQVGAGSRPVQAYELGYTHLAPTVEGNGMPGRWARVFTPEQRPYQLAGEAAANLLPVIDARASQKQIVIASSALSS